MISRVRLDASGPTMDDVKESLESQAEKIKPVLRQPVFDGDYLIQRVEQENAFEGRLILHPNVGEQSG